MKTTIIQLSVPEIVHRTIKAQAAMAGKNLNAYLVELLTQHATKGEKP